MRSRIEDVTFQTKKANAKLKVKLSLCFNWAPRHEAVVG
jgi:hypothetical protein